MACTNGRLHSHGRGAGSDQNTLLWPTGPLHSLLGSRISGIVFTLLFAFIRTMSQAERICQREIGAGAVIGRH